MRRRRYLVLAGTTTTAGLAGCLGGDDSENGGENGDQNGNESENGDENGADGGNGNEDGGNGDGNGSASATFELESVTEEPAELQAGQTLTVTAVLANNGDASGTETLSFWLADELVEERDVEVAGGQTQSVTFEVSNTSGLDPGSVAYSVVTESAGGSGRTLTVVGESGSATIQLGEVTPAEPTVAMGDSLELSVVVENTGDASTSEAVELSGGGLSGVQSVSLGPGEAQTVTFPNLPTADLGEGTHTLTISAGEASTEVQVTVGNGNGGEEEPSEGMMSVIEEYYDLLVDAQEAATPEEFLDIIRPVLHSQSPLIAIAESAGEDENPGQDTPIPDPDSAERTVVDRDLTATEIDEEHGLTIFPMIEESDLEPISGSNVVVEEDPNLANPDRSITSYFFLTQENGDWVIFMTYYNETTSGN